MRVSIKENVYVISVLSKINVVFFSFVSSVVINRYLGASMRGEYSYIMAYVGIISLLLIFGIGQSYSYFLRKYGNEIKYDFINIFFLQSIIYFLVILFISPYIESQFTIILIFSVLTQFNSQISFMSIVTNINKKNIINIISTFCYALCLVLVFFLSYKQLNYILFAYAFKVSFETVILIIKNKLYPQLRRIQFELVKELVKFSFLPMVISLLITLNYQFDIIILNHFLEYEQIGHYSVAVTLASMLWIIPNAFKDVLFNKTAKNDSITDITFSIKFNFYSSIFVIIGFFFLGKSFIELLYGIEFTNSFTVTLLLFIGCLPMIMFKMINTLYVSKGKQLFSFVTLFLAFIINIILNFIFIPFIGIEGAAISSIVSYLISGTVFAIHFSKNYHIKASDLIIFKKQDIQKIKHIIKKKNRHT